MTAHLIVNADDYGLTPGVSRGIRRAHQQGIVTTTTAMMNIPGALGDLRLAAAETPLLDFGVHLTLTAGQPLCPPDTIATIATPEGEFYPRSKIIQVLGDVDPEHLRTEWQAQIGLFLESGLPLNHLDSHHHCSYLDEVALGVMLDLAIEYGIPIRPPLGSSPESGMLTELLKDVASQMADFVPRVLADDHIPYPDHLISSFYGEQATEAHLLDIIAELPAGTTELICHPAEVDDDLRAISGYTDPRAAELTALTSPAVKDALAAHHVSLLTYKQFLFSWARDQNG